MVQVIAPPQALVGGTNLYTARVFLALYLIRSSVVLLSVLRLVLKVLGKS